MNLYDLCVMNKMVHGSQFTILWHVDDVKSSHKDPQVNDSFIAWLDKEYGQVNPVKALRGKKHDYFSMTLDYTEKGKVKIDMMDYTELMVAKFPQEDLQGLKVLNCASKNLFGVNKRSSRLDDERSEMLHSVVLKGLFMAKHSRPDLLQLITYLCMQMKEPTRLDWNKLVCIMKFLKQTKDDCLMLQSNSTHILIWSVNSSFAVHNDYCSHTGRTMMMGKGLIINISLKQKVNTRSSVKAEVIGVDDCIGPILWTSILRTSRLQC